ncbi:MAG: hypothetical protein IIC13_16775 [SAR324 cluster bacterium]|nr:hypothetical protein [SAR324 cluster bacterium]
MLVDPNSNLARSQGMAMRRAIDDEIIGAATAAALNGDGSTTAITAAQIIGDYTGEISFDIVTEVNEKFMENDIDPEVDKVFVVGPKQVRRMLQLTEVTSIDYQNIKALAGNGMVPNWMGFMWIMSNRLNVPSADQLDCLAFTRAAIGLQVNKDITARVAEDPSISFAWRIYCHMTIGAVRVEDRELVQVKLADTGQAGALARKHGLKVKLVYKRLGYVVFTAGAGKDPFATAKALASEAGVEKASVEILENPALPH